MEIEDKLNELDFDQACEVCGLIYLSFSRSTTVLEQMEELKEWGFTIPRELITEIDELSATDQMRSAAKLSSRLNGVIEDE